MRLRSILGAALFGVTLATVWLAPSEAEAQPTIPPSANRDENWNTVSNVTMVAGAVTVALMPRIYYSDPEATVGWKARWHVSVLAPAMTLTAATLLVDGPIRSAVESTRPGCTLEETVVAFPDSNCESFGGPSTQAFASWSATGAGLGIFLFDTIGHSDGEFHPGSFVGNVAVPLTLSIFTSVGRSVSNSDENIDAYEDVGQNLLAGALPGFVIGILTGIAYAGLQSPHCGYGNNVICW